MNVLSIDVYVLSYSNIFECDCVNLFMSVSECDDVISTWWALFGVPGTIQAPAVFLACPRVKQPTVLITGMMGGAPTSGVLTAQCPTLSLC